MKKILLLTALCFFGVSMVVYANKNEDNAKKYCREMMQKNPDHECKVSSWRGCGAGWTLDKTFRGSGKDYFACKRTKFHEKREEGTEQHLKSAEADCKRISEKGTKCKVERLVNCGRGWKKVKRYTGMGKDYSVCVPGNRFVNALQAIGKIAKRLALAPLELHRRTCGALQKKVPGIICSVKDLTKCPVGTTRINKLHSDYTKFIPICVPSKDFANNIRKLGLQEAGNVDGMTIYAEND